MVDVIALKYADGLVGAASAVAEALGLSDDDLRGLLSAVGDGCLFPGGGRVGAGQALFVRVPPLTVFDHPDVRRFAGDVLRNLLAHTPDARHLALTVHGVNFGLDPERSVRAELDGLSAGVGSGEYPPALESITIVDRSPQLVAAIERSLAEILPNGRIEARPVEDEGRPRRRLAVRWADGDPDTPGADEQFDIFISYNSSDSEHAREVSEFLEAHGLRTFFSKESLPILASDEYHEEIDRAIERARHMVVVTSSGANARSKWVKYEWRLFLGEKLAGRKTGNLITMVAGELPIGELPIGLRHREVLRLTPDDLSRLLEYARPGRRGGPAPGSVRGDPAERSVPRPSGDRSESGGPGGEVAAIGDFLLAKNELLTNTSWSGAARHARSLEIAGLSDWALPSVEQLQRIREAAVFPVRYCYWSGRESADGEAYYLHFDDGHVGKGPKDFEKGLSAVFVRPG